MPRCLDSIHLLSSYRRVFTAIVAISLGACACSSSSLSCFSPFIQVSIISEKHILRHFPWEYSLIRHRVHFSALRSVADFMLCSTLRNRILYRGFHRRQTNHVLHSFTD
ncbi:hypothetical protein SCHPADRAFT_700987 [Schizopora paradoxa]|uniref:Uncharacterized protein n=1 Tax=Schizopora paradoxa TaxID=27342 RepID=A0A0H2R2R3_9AGAM|nr:hypothetical protein SCHPADRAFT_700987 [Schizopora paradoxa]